MDRLHVVHEVAVVTGGVALGDELWWQREHLGDLGGDQPVICEPQRLIVHPPIEVTLLTEEGVHVVTAPPRPMMRGEHHLGAVAEQLDRFADVLRPGERIACLGASDRDEVVHRVRAVLRHAQPAVVGEEEVHLRRRLGLRGELELDAHSVDDELLSGEGDVLGRRDQAGNRQRDGFAEPGVDVPARSRREETSELVRAAPPHRVAGKEVLGDGFAHEVLGSDDSAVARIDIGLGGHAVHATEVVDVRVGVDHGSDRTFAERRVGELEAGPCGYIDGQRIDHHPSVGSGDEGDVADVVATRLPHTWCHLEETVDRVELRLSPQARVHGVGTGRILRDEGMPGDVPRRAERPIDHPGGVRRQQAT